MLALLFRSVFIVIMLAVLFIYLSTPQVSKKEGGEGGDAELSLSFIAIIVCGLVFAVGTLLLDVCTPKKSLTAISGVFFALLVGVFISWALSGVVELVNTIWYLQLKATAIQAIQVMLGVCICYLVITIVVRTKDDVRFIIPYIEFAKQTKGTRPLVVDTSAIIDGRLADLYETHLFEAPLIVPRFVLNELQLIADSGDKLKRTRGRRGLDILNRMQISSSIDVEIDDTIVPESEHLKGVDQKLVMFAKHCNGKIATTDYNLTKVAKVRDVDVVNINELANSLKAVALPGETMDVKIIKPGEESDQGIGYLDDGTMIVVEGARNKIGKELVVSVTSSLQTSAGKMIFGKFEGFVDKGEDNRNNKRRFPQRIRS